MFSIQRWLLIYAVNWFDLIVKSSPEPPLYMVPEVHSGESLPSLVSEIGDNALKVLEQIVPACFLMASEACGPLRAHLSLHICDIQETGC